MEIKEIIEAGGVGVLPTDTLYGLVGSALIPEAIERIYSLKRRRADKPLIVLIVDIEDVEQFGVVLSDKLRACLTAYWPGQYSVILPTIDEEFSYLSRAGRTIAFRLPDNDALRNIIREVGPLVAPSANIEGKPPARNIKEARKYFGDNADFYIDGEELSGKPSIILEWNGEDMKVVRQ